MTCAVFTATTAVTRSSLAALPRMQPVVEVRIEARRRLTRARRRGTSPYQSKSDADVHGPFLSVFALRGAAAELVRERAMTARPREPLRSRRDQARGMRLRASSQSPSMSRLPTLFARWRSFSYSVRAATRSSLRR